MRYTDDDIRDALSSVIRESGSLRKAAAALGFSPAFISIIMRRECPVSPHLAERLGYEDDGLRWTKGACTKRAKG